jgi:hypothetical protein
MQMVECKALSSNPSATKIYLKRHCCKNIKTLKFPKHLGSVVYACNTSYLGGGDQENYSSRSTPGKSS